MTRFNILVFLLAMSLLFNVFFLAGYMRATTRVSTIDTSEGAARLAAVELGLDKEQAAVFSGLRTEMQEDNLAYADALALAEQEFYGSLDGEDPDPAAVASLIEREMELHRQMRETAMRRVERFARMLSPEQRKALFGKVRGRFSGRGQRRRIMERFDVNRNGTLDPDEKVAADAHIAQMMERMRSRLDRNGNGIIEPEEKQAAREHMMRRPHRRGPDGERGDRGDRGGRDRNRDREGGR